MKDKIMIIWIDAEKHLKKYCILHDKNAQQIGYRGHTPQKVKDIYDKPIASIILNSESFESFFLNSGTR